MTIRRYLVLLMGWLGVILTYLLRVNVSVSIIPMAEEYNWDNGTQSIVLSSFFYGYISTQLFGGYFADRLGGKLVFGGGVIWACIFTLALPLCAAVSKELVVVSRILVGIGQGLTLPSMNSILAKWLPKNERSFGASVIASGMVMGIVVGYSLTPIVVDIHWKYAFYYYGCYGFLWAVWWFYLVSDTPEKMTDNKVFNCISGSEIDYIRSQNKLEDGKNSSFPFLSFFSCKHLWAIIAIHFADNWGYYVALSYLPTYMKDALHFDLKGAGFISVLPFFTMFLVKLGVGKLADFLISSGFLSVTATRKIMQSTACIGAGVFFFFVAVVKLNTFTTILFITLAIGLQGFESAGFQVNHIDISPKYAGILFGITNSAGTIPGMVGVGLVGYLRSNFGWEYVWGIAAVVYILGMIVYVIFATGEKIDFDHQDENGKQSWKYLEDYNSLLGK